MKYNAVIFDFDGTLADTGLDVWKSVEYAAQKAGGHMDAGFMKDRSNLAASMTDIFNAVYPPLSKQLFNQFKEDIKYHYRNVNQYPDTKLYPGVEKLLVRLKKENIPCFIISAKPLKALERILYLKTWDIYFNAWYSREMEDDVIIPKTKLIKQLIKEKLADYRAVYVGDTYTDVIAARESHIDCIAATYGDGNVNKLLSERPTHVIYNLAGLEDFF